MFKKILIFLFIFNVFCIPIASAQDNNVISVQEQYQIPDIKILPDNPLYPLKRLMERIGDFFTLGKGKQALRDLDIAKNRLWEATIMMAKDIDTEKIEKIVDDYGARLENSQAVVEKIKNEEQIEEYIPKIKESLSSHEVALEDVLNQSPEELTGVWDKAKEYISDYSWVLDNIREVLMEKLGEVAENIIRQEEIEAEIEGRLEDKKGN